LNQSPQISPIIPFHRERLSNGTNLLLKETSSIPLAAVDIWIGTGGASEPSALGGISHFLEHLFFKGTPTHPVGDMDRIVKSMGGYNNAATSYDYTRYYIVLPADHVLTALELLVDAFFNMSLPPEEVERERQVVLEEIARKEDSPQGKLYEDFLERAFVGTPYALPILGTEATLHTLDRDTIYEYHRSAYSPANIHISIAGDIDSAVVSDAVRRLLPENGSYGDPVSIKKCCVQAPVEKEFEVFKDVQQTYLCQGMATPSLNGTGAEISLDLLTTVLADGRSSRLVYKLTEQSGLCSDINAFYWGLEGIGLFGIDGVYDQENESEVQSVIREEIARLRSEDVGEEEFEKARTLLLTSHAYSLERIAHLAGTLGRHSLTDRLEELLNYENHLMNCDPATARADFNRYCQDDWMVSGYLRPENAE
jgi:zinc protease